MTGFVVEIHNSSRHLSLSRGFLVVSEKNGKVLEKLALDDIQTLIVSGRGCSHTSNLFVALGERNVPVVLCDSNYKPVSWILPLSGNGEQGKRFQQQHNASVPTNKRIWRDIVVCKIRNQAFVLEHCGSSGDVLRALSKKILSGDPTNIEAQAARYYWRNLFDTQFKRGQKESGANVLLNYGYTVMRSCVARAVVAAGLHPSLGVHHKHPRNPMCLVDDLIEPYRPLVDYTAWKITQDHGFQLDKETKARLCKILMYETNTEIGYSPIFSSCVLLAQSLVRIYAGEANKLELLSLENTLLFPI